MISFTSLAEMLEVNAVARGSQPAVRCDQQVMSWFELNRLADSVAAAVLKSGVHPQQTVGLLFNSRPEYPAAFVGALRAGAVATTISLGASVESQIALLSHAATKLVIADQSVAPHALRLYRALSKSSPTKFVSMGFSCEGWRTWNDWIDEGRGAVGSRVRARPEDTCTLSYSSGTTGEPKGITHSHIAQSMLATNLAWMQGIVPDSVVLQALPSYSNGCWMAQQPWLFAGATLVQMPQYHVELLLQLIETHRVTHAFLVPTQLYDLLNSPCIGTADLSSLKFVGTGGAPISADAKLRLQALLGSILNENYSNTEGVGTWLWPDEVSAHTHSVGRALPGTWVRIIGENGAVVPCGTEGRIVGRSPFMCSGYFKRSDLDAGLWWQDELGRQFARTDDVGYLDDSGYLYLSGRVSDMFICGGQNVHPSDIEAVVQQHPGVAECAVIGVSHERLGEVAVAFVVLRDTVHANGRTIQDWANAKLAKFQRLNEVHCVTSLPRNDLGKVIRRRLSASRAEADHQTEVAGHSGPGIGTARPQ